MFFSPGAETIVVLDGYGFSLPLTMAYDTGSQLTFCAVQRIETGVDLLIGLASGQLTFRAVQRIETGFGAVEGDL